MGVVFGNLTVEAEACTFRREFRENDAAMSRMDLMTPQLTEMLFSARAYSKCLLSELPVI
jgi:hypothetical protein